MSDLPKQMLQDVVLLMIRMATENKTGKQKKEFVLGSIKDRYNMTRTELQIVSAVIDLIIDVEKRKIIINKIKDSKLFGICC